MGKGKKRGETIDMRLADEKERGMLTMDRKDTELKKGKAIIRQFIKAEQALLKLIAEQERDGESLHERGRWPKDLRAGYERVLQRHLKEKR